MESSLVSRRLHYLWDTPQSLWGRLATVDHKIIGKRYLLTAMAFLVVGGIEALLLRVQLMESGSDFLSPEAYNQLFTMHGITMIFWYAAPILAGFGNYLVPLMLGCRDMALPRLNAFSYWTFLLSGLFIYGSFLFAAAPHGGWFAYVPYTLEEYSPGLHMDFYALSLIFLTISTTAGAVNFLVTIFRHRAPGMSINRMPLFMYSTATTSVLSILALPALTVACVFLLLDRNWGTHFFDPTHGGSPLLWQHVFWFFGHPWVYIIFLPATGMISMLLPVFARRPIVGYTYVAWATVLTGVVGFGVWVHHMFAAGMSQMSMSFFSAASMTISIFSAVQVFAWIATLWLGKPVMRTPLLFALGFLALFVIGGLNGIVTAVIPFDWQLTDTYFVVSHLHYVLVGANVFPVMAGFYYWLPKMTGKLMNETAGKWSFWLMFLGFNLGFFPMHLSGLAGMPRRIFTYDAEMGWDFLNYLTSIGAFVFALGVLVSAVNFFVSARRGVPAGNNPWKADSLEWLSTSPPPSYGSERVPVVRSRHPLWDAFDEEEDLRDERRFDHARDTLSTSAMDALPVAIARMPEDTVTPLIAALVLTGLFSALLVKAVIVAVSLTGLLGLVAAVWLWPEREKKAQ